METTNHPGDSKEEKPVAVNPNPAANENIKDKNTGAEPAANTDTVGSEITDGEDA
jgi:hypothetical protein